MTCVNVKSVGVTGDLKVNLYFRDKMSSKSDTIFGDGYRCMDELRFIRIIYINFSHVLDETCLLLK